MSKHWREKYHIPWTCLTKLTCGLPTLSLTINSSWLTWVVWTIYCSYSNIQLLITDYIIYRPPMWRLCFCCWWVSRQRQNHWHVNVAPLSSADNTRTQLMHSNQIKSYFSRPQSVFLANIILYTWFSTYGTQATGACAGLMSKWKIKNKLPVSEMFISSFHPSAWVEV